MFVKSITIKGFKSFAEGADLQLEPGITVVVGPNGSGKSNVVDALAWVLGAQAPSAVRSQKMDDVIFAGTAQKKALGRAEVSLTIDNSDGELALDFTEVTITRTLFRSGESEYSINGVECRLLDIQELLSDSGVGKQQHIIVSQGRIDAVLNARPEDRRAIIEEAAGVLKYRKRKERAERRLASTADDLNRLKDLAREVTRQIKPLKRQAEAASRHDALVEELNALKLYLAGRQLAALSGAVETSTREKLALANRQDELRRALAQFDSQVLTREAELSALGESDVGELFSSVAGLTERVRGQINVVQERRRRLTSELGNAVDEDLVANLEAESARIAAELAVTSAELDAVKPEFADLEVSEAALNNKQLSFDAQWGEGFAPNLARAGEVRTQIEALSSSSQRSDASLERVEEQILDTENRLETATKNKAQAGDDLEYLAKEVPKLEALLGSKVEETEKLESELDELTEKRRVVDSQVSHWAARHDALTQALEQARAEAGSETLKDSPGVLGVFADLLEIDSGWEKAVEAALGPALSAVVVEDSSHAAKALQVLSDNEFAGAIAPLNAAPFWPANEPESLLREHVRSENADINTLLNVILNGVEVIEGSWKQGYDKAVISPTKVFVTTEGDRFAPGDWRLSSGGSGASTAALTEAEEKLKETKSEADEVLEKLQSCKAGLKSATQAKADLQKRVLALEAEQRSAQAMIDRCISELDDCERGRAKLDQQRAEIFGHKQRDAEKLKALLAELPELEHEEAQVARQNELLASSRTEIEDQARQVAVKRSELEMRSKAAEERQASLAARKEEIEARLSGLVDKRAEAQERRVRIEAQLGEIDAIANTLETAQSKILEWKRILHAEQQAQSAAAREVSNTLAGLRKERFDSEAELSKSNERIGSIDISIAEAKVKLESLTDALRRELGADPQTATEAELPELQNGASPESQVRELERELQLIGVVNPLALQEYEELKERDEFLKDQIEDVNGARGELRTLITSIDDEITSVFIEAYSDVAKNFKALFNTLFPGGKGAVKLVNEDDLLSCGIEIEAKPSGKSVKKLSLLSGGERSLVALAFLFAVFRSRPSPFYVMDEVEAALDDLNLSRFLSLIEEFRKEAQLIIVSHQKRTMECADVLYGVSMKPGGSSKVISESAADNRDLKASVA